LLPDVGSASFFQTGSEFYYGVIRDQGLFILLFVVFVGSDLIARDRRYNTLQLYFSKPLTPNDYILGKLGIVASFLLMITWIPVLLLWLFGLSVETRDGYFAEVWAVPFAATGACAVLIAVAGMLVLALSAVGRRAVFIAVSWLILFGWGPMGFPVMILQALSNRESWGLIRMAGNVDHVAAWFFGVPGPYEFHPLASLAVVVAVVVACYVVLRRKIVPVEVVL
jgi:ABC-type transport system involved in multi-copper enzyme maturation permease subunit